MEPFDRERRERWQANQETINARKATSRQVSVQQLLDQLQSPDRLRMWLQAKQPTEIVGEAQTPDETVLANFLWETLGAYVLAFGFELWRLEGDPVELPAWCGEFARVQWEHNRMRPSASANGKWTAAEALAMLEETGHRIQRE